MMSVLAEGQAILSRGLEGGQNRKGGGEIGLSLEPAHFFTSTQHQHSAPSTQHYSANTPTCPPVCQNITVSESLNRPSRT